MNYKKFTFKCKVLSELQFRSNEVPVNEEYTGHGYTDQLPMLAYNCLCKPSLGSHKRSHGKEAGSKVVLAPSTIIIASQMSRQ